MTTSEQRLPGQGTQVAATHAAKVVGIDKTATT